MRVVSLGAVVVLVKDHKLRETSLQHLEELVIQLVS